MTARRIHSKKQWLDGVWATLDGMDGNWSCLFPTGFLALPGKICMGHGALEARLACVVALHGGWQWGECDGHECVAWVTMLRGDGKQMAAVVCHETVRLAFTCRPWDDMSTQVGNCLDALGEDRPLGCQFRL